MSNADNGIPQDASTRPDQAVAHPTRKSRQTSSTLTTAQDESLSALVRTALQKLHVTVADDAVALIAQGVHDRAEEKAVKAASEARTKARQAEVQPHRLIPAIEAALTALQAGGRRARRQRQAGGPSNGGETAASPDASATGESTGVSGV